MADEKNTGEKWMDFFFGEPKRTVIIILSILTLIVMFSPELQQTIITAIYSLVMNALIPLILMLLGLSLIWNKTFGKKKP